MIKNKLKSKNSQDQNPSRNPIPQTYKILNEFPKTMDRYLRLIDERSYAATWIPVSIQISEIKDKNGKIVKLDKPIERTETKLVIIRDDGTIYGIDNLPLSALDFQINLAEYPQIDKLLSPTAFLEYKKGIRPNPKDVFQRIVDVVSFFLDFSNSIADQQTMSEFIACYILTTWFLDAYNVIGFLWPTGERGCGKTNLLNVVADLSYLGQVILAGGSYASLRDMADNGATLAFDDAENLADPKKSDPDKRALLLAGNRRGATVTLKEPDGKNRWKIRHVNAFCHRLFSSINLPESVLASRSIVVPLIRTDNHNIGNRDPADHALWPHDWRKLIDDLWVLATVYLPEMKIFDELVGNSSSLVGRSLQPWRAVLAVAAWLEKNGVNGIQNRMINLADNYQQEKPEFEVSDFTSLVIHAIFECANNTICSKSANHFQFSNIELSALDITKSAKNISINDEWDIDIDYINTRRVGRVMSSLRFKYAPRPGGSGSRRRIVKIHDLERLSKSYGIPLPQSLAKFINTTFEPQIINGSNGKNGKNGSSKSYHQIAFDELADSPILHDICKPCFVCGTQNWKVNQNGDEYYCATCHPLP